MSRRGGTRVRATKKPVVVVAGEDRTDRQVLRTLLEEFCPDMRGRIVEISDDVRLRRASDGRLQERVRTLARKAAARAERERAGLACVFVQEDLDRPVADDYGKLRQRVQDALCGKLGTAHYVLVAAETEAWLLLFPGALNRTVSNWHVPRQYRGVDTARVGDPKRVLTSAVSSSDRRYRESDAPDVIAWAVELGEVYNPSGTNRSWSQLRDDADECCGQHIAIR